MTESVQSCFELSIHFTVFFSRELFLVAAHGWFAIQTNVLFARVSKVFKRLLMTLKTYVHLLTSMSFSWSQ